MGLNILLTMTRGETVEREGTKYDWDTARGKGTKYMTMIRGGGRQREGGGKEEGMGLNMTMIRGGGRQREGGGNRIKEISDYDYDERGETVARKGTKYIID